MADRQSDDSHVLRSSFQTPDGTAILEVAHARYGEAISAVAWADLLPPLVMGPMTERVYDTTVGRVIRETEYENARMVRTRKRPRGAWVAAEPVLPPEFREEPKPKPDDIHLLDVDDVTLHMVADPGKDYVDITNADGQTWRIVFIGTRRELDLTSQAPCPAPRLHDSKAARKWHRKQLRKASRRIAKRHWTD